MKSGERRKRKGERGTPEKEDKSPPKKCSRTCKDPRCDLHPERDRKKLYRERKSKVDGRAEVDGRVLEGQMRKRKKNMERNAVLKKLKVSVCTLTNENRVLKRKQQLEGRIQSRVEERLQDSMGDGSEKVDGEEVDDMEVDSEEVDSEEVDSEKEVDPPLMSSSLLNVMSPKNQKKVFRRLSQKSNFTTVKKNLRKEGHRINLRDSLVEMDEVSDKEVS